MNRRELLVLALGASLTACGSEINPPPSNPANCVNLCDGGAPRGGGGGGGGGGVVTTDGGGATADATTDGPVTSVAGTVRTWRDLPPGSTLGPAAGWTVRTLPPLDADAGVFNELTAVTDGNGAFTLPGVPLRQTLPGESATGYWLLATAPAAGRISSLFTARDNGPLLLDTVNDDTVRTVINAAGLVQADDRAMIAVLVRQSTVRDALPVRNVRVQADGQASSSLYDGVGGVEIAETGTGPLGFALLPNVPVPAGGDGLALVIADRAARPYQVRVRRGAISWLVVVSI